MTAKFIPFDPNTAKNGDILHYSGRPEWSYIYIGPCTDKEAASVVFNPRDNTYGFNYNDSMVVKQPMRTVWINLYENNREGYWYTSEDKALSCASKHSDNYIGTFPIEIPA